MKAKSKLKWILDILMTAVLLLLMGYQFWGEKVHEWIGGMFVLFFAYQICNLGWYKSLFQRRYTLVHMNRKCKGYYIFAHIVRGVMV